MTRTLAIGGYSDADQAILSDTCDALFCATLDDLALLPDELRQGITALAYKTHHAFGGAQMDLLPSLGLIANFGVGYDAIDVDAATTRGIHVTNTPEVLNDDVADLAIALWIDQGRRLRASESWLRDGKWAGQGPFPLAHRVSGRTAGVMGLGRIGRAIADRLTGFGMDIYYHARSEKKTPGWTYHADKLALAQAVDTLFVALKGGPDTEGYVDADVIAALGDRGVIVNISRGSTIDEAAMLDALETGQLAGAGLDVFLNEPDINPRFLALDCVALQPHVGSATVETRAAMADLQRANILAHLHGHDVLTPVNSPTS